LSLDISKTVGYNQGVMAEELKRLRKRMGMTQAELAAALGVWQVTVGRWEAGMRSISEPTARLIERIAKEVKPRRTTKRKR
jgi:transcriptional regulator with XRE-family HTH domain